MQSFGIVFVDVLTIRDDSMHLIKIKTIKKESFFMKKLNIKWFLTVSLGISGILTIVVAFTKNIEQQWIIYYFSLSSSRA